MQNRVFIIHGWCGYPEEGWFPWLKKELEKNGFTAEIPKMPNTEAPKIEEWVSHLQKTVGEIDENTYFVGHSIGAQAVLRYLAMMDGTAKAGGAVFVAGWFTLKDWPGITAKEKEIAKPWLEMPIDVMAVRRRVKKITAIFSANDYTVPVKNAEYFEKRLGAEIIIENNRGHFSGDDGVTELPSALQAVLFMG